MFVQSKDAVKDLETVWVLKLLNQVQILVLPSVENL